MIKKKFLSLLAAVALVCGLVGCQADTGAETYSQTVKSENTSIKVDTKKSNETTIAKSNSKEAQFDSEFEIIDWTMEDFLSDIEINGEKISLPCSYEELCKHFNLKSDSFFEFNGYYYYSYALRDDLYILTSYHSENETDNPSAEEMYDFYLSYTNDSCSFRFGEIKSSSSTREDVEKILGKPNDGISISNESWYRFDDFKAVIITYNKNGNIDHIHCYFGE